jgi:hypothetical protein
MQYQHFNKPVQYRARKQAVDLRDSRLLTRAALYPCFNLQQKEKTTLMAERSQPNTLLKQPSATIYLDGLLVFCYDKRQKRVQVGIHTRVHFHALTIKVKERGQATDIPTLILEHEHIKKIAPLFLYVEKREGSGKPNGAATLYKPDDPSYSQAFANVVDLRGAAFHKNDHLRIKPNILAPLNILNGEFYSASLGSAKRMNLEGDPNPFNLGLVSTRVAADISNIDANLVLRSGDDKAEPLISLPLDGEKHYEVYIFNEPTDNHEPDTDHSHDHSGDDMPENGQLPINHFNVYYEALDLKDRAIKYMVEVVENPGPTLPDPGSIVILGDADPPCIIVEDGGISELPEWSRSVDN